MADNADLVTDSNSISSKVHPCHQHIARGGFEQCGEDLDQRGLAGPVGTENGDELPLFDLEINAL